MLCYKFISVRRFGDAKLRRMFWKVALQEVDKRYTTPIKTGIHQVNKTKKSGF